MSRIVVLAALALAACGPRAELPAQSPSDGTIAFARGRIFVADTDTDRVQVVDPSSLAVVANVPVGRRPTRMAARNGLVFVVNQGESSVSVIDPALAAEVQRMAVGAEPVAIAAREAGHVVVVANRAGRSLSIVDDRGTRTVPLVAAPSGVAIGNDETWVSYGRSGWLTRVSLADGRIVNDRLVIAYSPEETAGFARVAGQAIDPLFDAVSARWFVLHTEADREAVFDPRVAPPAHVAQPRVWTALAALDSGFSLLHPLDADGDCPTDACDDHAPALLSREDQPGSAPSAALLDVSGHYVYWTDAAADTLGIWWTDRSAVTSPSLPVGRGPTGIALDPTGVAAYVHGSLDHTISVVTGARDGGLEARIVPLGAASVDSEVERGRLLFHAGNDARLSRRGLACASCHPEGRDDGRTWGYPDGPRNTPSLAGRALTRTGPWHWDGRFDSIGSFRKTVSDVMHGAGLPEADLAAIFAYLDTLPAPVHPPGAPDAEARGKALFEGRATCATCHPAPDFTDRARHDVGTIHDAGSDVPESFPADGVDTPSLLGVFASPPYLHDGSVGTLRERIVQNPGDRHGVTSGLSAAEVDDLVAYLESL